MYLRGPGFWFMWQRSERNQDGWMKKLVYFYLNSYAGAAQRKSEEKKIHPSEKLLDNVIISLSALIFEVVLVL